MGLGKIHRTERNSKTDRIIQDQQNIQILTGSTGQMGVRPDQQDNWEYTEPRAWMGFCRTAQCRTNKTKQWHRGLRQEDLESSKQTVGILKD
jgi:hypothetical protein